MFPIRDTIPTRRFPIVNACLIGLNILAFLLQLSLSEEELIQLVYTYGVVPANYGGTDLLAGGFLPFLSCMFLHGGWMHLIGNVWTLYIFGDNVEDRLGRWQYIGFYLVSGIAASIAHILFNAGSDVPVIGASGAISGVMGAYLVFYPKSKITMLFPIFYIPFFFRISSFIYLGYWLVLQLFNGTTSLMTDNPVDNVAFWAHIGGFVAGIALALLFRYKQFSPPETYQTHKRPPKPFVQGKFRENW